MVVIDVDEMTRIAGVGLVMAVLLVYIKGRQPELAAPLSIAFVVIVLLMVLPSLGQILRIFRLMTDRAQVNQAYLGTVLKAIGIAYIATFSAHLCRDAGQNAMAVAVEMTGKVLILLLALPILAGILEALIGILP